MKRIVRLHYNKFKAVDGLPWTLHTSNACYSASHVTIRVPIETEEKPSKTDNPRYFLTCHADITWEGTEATLQ